MSQMRVVTIGTIFSHCLTLYIFALYRHIEQTNRYTLYLWYLLYLSCYCQISKQFSPSLFQMVMLENSST